MTDSRHWFNAMALLDSFINPTTGCWVYNKAGIDTEYYRSNFQISYGDVLAKKGYGS